MTDRKISGNLKKGLIAMTMAMMAMAITACGTDEDTASQSYDTSSGNYTVTDDSGYDSSCDSGIDYTYEYGYDSDYSDIDEEYVDEEEADSSAVTSCDYDGDWNYETVCDEDYGEEWDDDEDYGEDWGDDKVYDEEENSGFEPDSNADYASDAQVRTNDVEFTVGHPKVGGTEAELEAEVINRNGGTITMIGCTVYDDMGIVLDSWNESCNITDSTFDITCSTKDDLNYILDDIIYHYRFVAEIDGEFYTHQAETFTTNHADDKFMLQVQPVELTKETATVSVEITNPTMARVANVGCRVYTPQGLQLLD